MSSQPNVKLCQVKLPRFSGNPEDWPLFKSLYVPLVHNNPSLDSVQKLIYLEHSVSGQAAQIISSLRVNDKNYTKAWRRISERYERL